MPVDDRALPFTLSLSHRTLNVFFKSQPVNMCVCVSIGQIFKSDRSRNGKLH